MKVGVLGLGKMGGGIAAKLLEDGHEVIVWNRSKVAIQEFVDQNPGVKSADTIESLVSQLDSPKVFWIMVPHSAVEEVLTEIRKFVSTGDVVIDGGNSNYKETQERFDSFEKDGVHFLGIGVSGGVLARKNGFPLMVGGSSAGYELIKSVLDSLAKPHGGHEYFGAGGAGHFVKMVHNGIEYGMMQSIGEGFEVLEKSKYQLDLPKVASLWQKRTIVSGFLLDRLSEELKTEPDLSSFSGIVSRSGEADWTLEVAKDEGVTVPVIEASINFRKDSETDEGIQKSFTARIVNALRKSFGGHEVKRSPQQA